MRYVPSNIASDGTVAAAMTAVQNAEAALSATESPANRATLRSAELALDAAVTAKANAILPGLMSTLLTDAAALYQQLDVIQLTAFAGAPNTFPACHAPKLLITPAYRPADASVTAAGGRITSEDGRYAILFARETWRQIHA